MVVYNFSLYEKDNPIHTSSLIFVYSAHATHLRAGQIEVKQISTLTVKVTVTVFTNTNSTVLFGGEQDMLNFGDGTPGQLATPKLSAIRLT